MERKCDTVQRREDISRRRDDTIEGEKGGDNVSCADANLTGSKK
jgi:hypothetical protein